MSMHILSDPDNVSDVAVLALLNTFSLYCKPKLSKEWNLLHIHICTTTEACVLSYAEVKCL